MIAIANAISLISHKTRKSNYKHKRSPVKTNRLELEMNREKSEELPVLINFFGLVNTVNRLRAGVTGSKLGVLNLNES